MFRWLKPHTMEIVVYGMLGLAAALMLVGGHTAPSLARGSLKDPPDGYYRPALTAPREAPQLVTPPMPAPRPNRLADEPSTPSIEARRNALFVCASYYYIMAEAVAQSRIAPDSVAYKYYRRQGQALLLELNRLPYRADWVDLSNQVFFKVFNEYEEAQQQVSIFSARYAETCYAIAQPLVQD